MKRIIFICLVILGCFFVAENVLAADVSINISHRKFLFIGETLNANIVVDEAFVGKVKIKLLAEEKVIFFEEHVFNEDSLEERKIPFSYKFSDSDFFAEYSIQVNVDSDEFIEDGIVFLPKTEYLHGKPWVDPNFASTVGYTIIDQRMCSNLILTKVLYWINDGYGGKADFCKFAYLGRNIKETTNAQIKGFWVADDNVFVVKMMPEQNIKVGETFCLKFTNRNEGPCSFEYEEAAPFSGDKNEDGLVNLDDFINFSLEEDNKVRIGVSCLDQRKGWDTSGNCGFKDHLRTDFIIWLIEKGDQSDFIYKGSNYLLALDYLKSRTEVSVKGFLPSFYEEEGILFDDLSQKKVLFPKTTIGVGETFFLEFVDEGGYYDEYCNSLQGDIDGDRVVSISDVILSLQIVSGVEIDPDQIILQGRNGKIGLRDAIFSLEKVAGKR